MRQRCQNPNNDKFADYGGRGIGCDPRWDKFETFLADMGERPTERSLDRIDNDLGYSPDNCRWATRIEQWRNRRCTVYCDYEGKRWTVAALAQKLGLHYSTLHSRVVGGWPESKLPLRPQT